MEIIRCPGLSSVVLVMTRVGCRLIYCLDESLRFPAVGMSIPRIISLGESFLLLMFGWTRTTSVWIQFCILYLNKPVCAPPHGMRAL